MQARFGPKNCKLLHRQLCFRTVTETLSLKDDLGQDAKEKPEQNGEKGTNGAQEFDTLELRNR